MYILELIHNSSSDHPNMPNSPEVDLVCSARLAQLCRIDDSLLDDLTNQFNALQVKQEPPTVSDSGASDLNCTAGASAQSGASTNTTLVVSPAITPTEPPDGDEEDESDRGFEDENLGWRTSYTSIDRDSDSDRDFTACSAEDCGYCGKCSY